LVLNQSMTDWHIKDDDHNRVNPCKSLHSDAATQRVPNFVADLRYHPLNPSLHPHHLGIAISNAQERANDNVRYLLIGGNCGPESNRVVATERGQALADEFNTPFIECSASANINVDAAFRTLTSNILRNMPIQLHDDHLPRAGNKCC